MSCTFTLPFLILLVVTGLSLPVQAEADAEALFHPAARDYIIGLIDEAEEKVNDALRQFPDDRKLLRLKELIEQQKKEQEQQPDSQPDAPSDPREPSDPEEQPDTPTPPDPSPQHMEEPDETSSWDEEEALRILDAMRQNEQDQRRDLRPVLGPAERVEKDW